MLAWDQTCLPTSNRKAADPLSGSAAWRGWLVFAYVGGLHPLEPERALVMAPVPRTELSPGPKAPLDAMTRTCAARSEAATSPWLRAYALGVINICGHLSSGV